MDTASDSDIQRYIEKVREASREWRYRDVLDICAEAEGENIVDPALLASKSAALVGLKKYREAQELLEKSLEEFPDDPTLHYNLATTCFARRNRKGGRAEAIRVLELLEGVHPDEIDERPAYIEAGSLMLLSRISEAREFLEYEVARFPESPRLHTQLAVAYLRRGHWIKGLKQVQRIPGENHAYIRRTLVIRLLSLICILVAGVGFIAINHIIDISSLTSNILFLIFLLIVAVLFIINRRRVLMPPDRSQRNDQQTTGT
jgi:tetratricopeptide (TPR) repeat protein